MKAILTTIVLALHLISMSYAQADNEAYINAMTNAIDQYDSARSLDQYQEIANRFERIAQMESEEWLPRYYVALTYVYMSFSRSLENTERDGYLEKAQSFADLAEEISNDNVEVVVLMGYIKMAKLSVNPAVRGMVLTPQVNSLFNKARKMDPENPRAAIMLARMKYGTAQFFKSSTEESCALAQTSLELFDQEEDRGIQPHWGKGLAEGMIQDCSETK